MLILFQEGIPDLFFHALKKQGMTVDRFPTNRAAALQILRGLHSAEVIFFRANFVLDAPILDLLPQLKLAVLVSTGTDSVDFAELGRRGIRIITGEGVNAQAVCDYVLQALCFGGFDFARHALGIVGKGRIGSLVMTALSRAQVRLFFYDPFVAGTGSLEEVLSCDYVTFHTPLTREGEHRTSQMLNTEYFQSLRKKIHLIQTCRGGIWHREFYLRLPYHPYIRILAQDVYPEEPPPENFLKYARFSTPHIAGYSTRGRLGGILRGIRCLLPDFSTEELMPISRAWFLDQESERFARAAREFHRLRDEYYWRKEFSEYDAREREDWLKRFPKAPAEVFFPRDSL